MRNCTQWTPQILGSLCKFKAGSAFPKMYQGRNAGNLPFIKVSDLKRPSNGFFIRESANWISNNELTKIKASPLPAGTVVFAKIGEGLKAERFRIVTRTTCIDNNMMGAIPLKVESRFLYYLLTFTGVAHLVEGSALPYLRQSDLEQIKVWLPTLSEQQAIATTLGALDDKIESNASIISLGEALSLTLFNKLFDVVHIDTGVAIGDLIGINRRHSLKKGENAVYIGMSSLPQLSPSIHVWNKKPFGSGQKFVNGDVLMARITPCLENGKTAIVDMLTEGETAWGSTEFIVLSPEASLTTPWVYSLVRSEPVRDWAIKQMNGSSGRQRFNASEFDNYKISPPTGESLETFNKVAVPTFQKITQARDEMRRLTTLRNTLLPELMSGRIRVAEAKDAVQAATDTEFPEVGDV